MLRNDAHGSEEAKNHAVRFVAVTDSRKRKIRGSMERGDRYYAQMRMEVEGGQTKPKRIALKAATLDQAQGGTGKGSHREPGLVNWHYRAAGQALPSSRTNISRASLTTRKAPARGAPSV